MAQRIRQTRPEFFRDNVTGRLPVKYREFFRSLFHMANDYGIGPCDLGEIQANIYPLCPDIDEHYIKECLDYLEEKAIRDNGVPLLVRFEAISKNWFLIPTFRRHQGGKGEEKSGYPNPPGWVFIVDKDAPKKKKGIWIPNELIDSEFGAQYIGITSQEKEFN